MLGRELDEAFAQRHRRSLRSLAVDVGARGGRRRRCIGHLAGIRRGDTDAIDVDLQLFGHDLRDLREQPLSHLGSAVVQHQRAVRIDMEQAAGLVQVRGGERDAEFDRRERDAALEDQAAGVERADRLAPRVIVGALFELPHDVVDHVVDDRLVVVRDVALVDAVEIELAHVEGILAEVARDLVDDALDAHHALRPAEAAERGIRHRVGLAAEGKDADVFEDVADGEADDEKDEDPGPSVPARPVQQRECNRQKGYERDQDRYRDHARKDIDDRCYGGIGGDERPQDRDQPLHFTVAPVLCLWSRARRTKRARLRRLPLLCRTHTRNRVRGAEGAEMTSTRQSSPAIALRRLPKRRSP